MGQTDCRELIRSAFAHRPYPGDNKIAVTNERYPDYEGHQVANFFKGRDWRRVALETLLNEYQGDPHATMSFMFDEGFCYYLPAFLLMALDPQGGEIADSLVFALTAPEQHAAGDFDRFRARMERLSTEERAAVICTLRRLVELYDRDGLPINPAKVALQRYWEPS